MTRLPFLLLGLVATALAVAISQELDTDTVTRTRPASPRPPAVVAEGASGSSLPDPTAAAREKIAAVLARPLFNPDRRAAASTGGDSGAPEPPRLAGILIGPAGRSAIFAGVEEGRPVVLREGGRVGSFTVRDIAPTQVTVLGPSGPRVLRPSFDGAPPAPPVVGVAGPAARPGIPFNQIPAPSGLDILRNAARDAPRPAEGETAVPGVDQLGVPPRAPGAAR